MVSIRAEEANQYGKYDRKIPQNAQGRKSTKGGPNPKPEAVTKKKKKKSGGGGRTLPEMAGNAQELPINNAPVPTPRPPPPPSIPDSYVEHMPPTPPPRDAPFEIPSPVPQVNPQQIMPQLGGVPPDLNLPPMPPALGPGPPPELANGAQNREILAKVFQQLAAQQGSFGGPAGNLNGVPGDPIRTPGKYTLR